MKNKKQINHDLAIAFEFVEQIFDNPDSLDKIPDGAEISFLDEENVKSDKRTCRETSTKYVKVKRHFELL